MIDQFMVGGMIKQKLSQKNDFLEGNIEKPSDRDLENIALKGLENGIDAMLKHVNEMEATNKQLVKFLKDAKKHCK